ncbi:DUF1460 domain-containing protein [bacterium]|nr:DUF1460 domain-containing protein [bacterium]
MQKKWIDGIFRFSFLLVLSVEITSFSRDINRPSSTIRDVLPFDKNKILIAGDRACLGILSQDRIFDIYPKRLNAHGLNGICFVDSLNGWVVGAGGLVLHTSDGSKSWKIMPNIPPFNLHACAFKNKKQGFVAGSDGIILTTRDGGVHWEFCHKKRGLTIFAIQYLNDTTIYAVGESGYVVASHNDGRQWREVKLDSLTGLNNLYGIGRSGQACIIYGSNATWLWSNDAGESWFRKQNVPLRQIRKMCSAGDQIIAVGDSGMIITTADFGENWDTLSVAPDITLYGLSKDHDSGFFAAGSKGTIVQFNVTRAKGKGQGNRSSIVVLDVSKGAKGNSISDAFLKASETYFMGKPYVNDPLGEAFQDGVDDDPRFNLECADCVTLIEQSLALALSGGKEDFLGILDRIRYRGGAVSFFNRNHFFVADWIPHNSWIVEDVTTVIGGSYSERCSRTIGRTKFFASKGMTIPQIADIPNYETYFIPFKDADKILSRIQKPLIVVFIGNQDWLFARHTGILFKDPKSGEIMIRHASSLRMRVVDQDLREYLSGSKSIVGIKLLQIYE